VHVEGSQRSDSTQTLVGAGVGACVTNDPHVHGQYAFDAGYSTQRTILQVAASSSSHSVWAYEIAANNAINNTLMLCI